MSKKRDKRAARRIHQGLAPRGPRTISEHNRANTLELAWAAVMGGELTYTQYTLLQLDLYPARDWDEPM